MRVYKIIDPRIHICFCADRPRDFDIGKIVITASPSVITGCRTLAKNTKHTSRGAQATYESYECGMRARKRAHLASINNIVNKQKTSW